MIRRIYRNTEIIASCYLLLLGI